MISSAIRSSPEGFLAKRARLRRIAARFDCSGLTKGYIVGKLATDPAYGAVLQQFGRTSRPIVDIGCGLGLLAHFLRDHGCNAPIHGHDFDKRKIRLARAAAERAGLRDVTFTVGDAADHLSQDCHLVLLDVIHYLEPDVRASLLRRLAAHALSDGGVLIRSAVRDRTWRYRLTVTQEFWTRWSGWIPSPGSMVFPTLEEIVSPFEAAGCHVETRPLWGRTPFNSHLVVASGQAE